MKKHNEGYALAFVLVVFIIISLVAVAILTVSMNNLQSQKASIQRMEARYAAQGEIEKVEAILRDSLNGEELDISSGILNADTGNKISNTVITLEAVNSELVENKVQSLLLYAVTTKENVQITAVFQITGTNIAGTGGSTYKVTAPVITYDSYTISTIEPSTESVTEESGGG